MIEAASLPFGRYEDTQSQRFGRSPKPGSPSRIRIQNPAGHRAAFYSAPVLRNLAIHGFPRADGLELLSSRPLNPNRESELFLKTEMACGSAT